MRLFVAIVPAGAVRDSIATTASAWLDGRSDVRLVPADNLHITLAFLGNVDADTLDLVATELGEACAGCSPFELQTTAWGTFPSRGRPRVCWLGVAPCADLEHLARRVRSHLNPFREGLAAASLRPHITVGRATRKHNGPILIPAEGPPQAIAWRVEAIQLVHSQLGSGPARHRVMDSFALEGESPLANRRRKH